jgi:hypothetical protein
MSLKLQNIIEENTSFQIISYIIKKGNIYEAKIIKDKSKDKQKYILNMWFGNLPNIISDGKINIICNIPNFPKECNYNIKPIEDLHCECCAVRTINQLNRPPLNLIKINYILEFKI